MREADVAVIGGGIVGLATAYQLTQRFPKLRVVVLEKEARPAVHQTGHNSGVLHSGIYYKPGSLKAVNCREGKRAMELFCRSEGIDYEICGKVIVAVGAEEVPRMRMIYERGVSNGVVCEWIGPERLHELEPHAAGVGAIHVKEAGIVNFRQVCERLAARVGARGESGVHYGCRVTGMREGERTVVIETSREPWETRFVVNCAGLQSDRVAAMSGARPGMKIVPFRGEYYEVKPEAHGLCRNLIYPVPDPSFPFLGVHFTRMVEGGVECGPNAVLALGREAYNKDEVNWEDLIESLSYPGFLRLAASYWSTGLGEIWRSISKAAFVRALQRLVPDVREEHLRPAPAGIRAQAVSDEGLMVDDFFFLETRRVVNVCNAPSPAATASLNIGKLIVDTLQKHF